MPQPARVRSVGLIAPTILVVVAALGIGRHVVADQSSWSGAAFGMFATIDSEATRQIRAYISPSDSPVPVTIPAELQRRGYEVLVLPTQDRLDAFAQELAARLKLGGDRYLSVEIWGLDFDGDSGILTRRLIVESHGLQ